MQQRSLAVFVIAIVPVITTAQQFLPAPPGAAVDPNLRFEVVSIKPFVDASGPMFLRMTPGRFDSSGVPVSLLLRQALQKPDYQIVGAPGWIDSERYTIAAKVPDGAPPAAMTMMMVNLLKDRFQLATHLETREIPIFNLVVARSDGRLGPDLKVTSAECQATIAERIAAAKETSGRGAPPLPALPGPNDPMPCGFASLRPGSVSGSGRTLAQIVPILADLARRPVIDKTGLGGLYDFSLKFLADSAGSASPFGPPPGAPPEPVDPNAPSFSTAVQEQLGLRLENGRGPTEVVVIDKFEKATLDQ